MSHDEVAAAIFKAELIHIGVDDLECYGTIDKAKEVKMEILTAILQSHYGDGVREAAEDVTQYVDDFNVGDNERITSECRLTPGHIRKLDEALKAAPPSREAEYRDLLKKALPALLTWGCDSSYTGIQRAKDLHSEVTAALSDMEGNREGEINLNSLQEEVAVWTHKNFDNQEPFEPLLGAVEELGELSHHWLKRFQGIRGSAEMHRKEEIDAVGDVVIYLMSFCDLNGYDFHNCVKRAWMEVRDRNWKANPDGEGYGNPNKEITAALSDKEGT